jgi:hypothetical protein
VVIKAVEQMAEQQGIKSLKLHSRHNINFPPADWIAGVDYEEENDDNANNNDDYADDAEIEDEAMYDPVDQAELDEILAEENENIANPTGGDEELKEPEVLPNNVEEDAEANIEEDVDEDQCREFSEP